MSSPAIVVPLDGSPLAEHALVPAVSIAARLGADVHLIHVRERGESTLLPPVLPLMYAAVDVSAPADAVVFDSAYLQTISERIRPNIGPGTIVTTHPEGSAPKTIIDYAHDVSAAMIVIATRRHDGSHRKVISSVADKVARRAGIPVLMVGPETTPVRRAAAWDCERILIPLDGSAIAGEIVVPAAALASRFSAHITLLTILSTEPHATGWLAMPTGATIEEAEQEAIVQLDSAARALRRLGLNVDTRIVRADQPAAEAIINEATATNTDVIAIATRGHGFAKRFAFGSVAQELVNHAVVPTLVLSPANPQLPEPSYSDEIRRSILHPN
jgi:nucleotide-binding universal stress UspA family protein